MREKKPFNQERDAHTQTHCSWCCYSVRVCWCKDQSDASSLPLSICREKRLSSTGPKGTQHNSNWTVFCRQNENMIQNSAFTKIIMLSFGMTGRKWRSFNNMDMEDSGSKYEPCCSPELQLRSSIANFHQRWLHMSLNVFLTLISKQLYPCHMTTLFSKCSHFFWLYSEDFGLYFRAQNKSREVSLCLCGIFSLLAFLWTNTFRNGHFRRCGRDHTELASQSMEAAPLIAFKCSTGEAYGSYSHLAFFSRHFFFSKLGLIHVKPWHTSNLTFFWSNYDTFSSNIT